ncbi:MAG: hypothetical protein HYS98_05210 [Deltaproteobacteria bacterium]|nr:hypothetical protein [Deltaproteobacteria bacterium]
MILVDTSVWIEFFKVHEPWHTSLTMLLEERQVTTLECIFGELLQGAKSHKEVNFILEYWNYLNKIDVENLWIEGGKLSFKNKFISKGVGLIDIVILCAAVNSHSKLWTLDQKLLNVCPVEFQYQSLN